MTKEQFLENIEQNCSEITFLSVKHMSEKIYKGEKQFDKDENIEFFSNYKNYHLYLNDFAATIYSRYASSVNNIYIEVCEVLDISVDNKYTLEHTIMKLEKQTPQLLLGLTDEDIQKQTIMHFDEKLEAIDGSTHYNGNLEEFKNRVDKLKSNIKLVKDALNYQS